MNVHLYGSLEVNGLKKMHVPMGVRLCQLDRAPLWIRPGAPTEARRVLRIID